MLAIAECLYHSMKLHLDSFESDQETLLAQTKSLHSELVAVGDMLRAAMLDKRVSELTDQDRHVSKMLLPGRHIKSQGSRNAAGQQS